MVRDARALPALLTMRAERDKPAAHPDTSTLARTNSIFMNENSHRGCGSAGRSESRLGERTGNEALRGHGIPTPTPQTGATEKPFGSLFTLTPDPLAGSGQLRSDLTAGGGLPMFRSRPARPIP